MYYYSIFFKGLASIYEKTYYYLAGTYGKHFCRVIRASWCMALGSGHGRCAISQGLYVPVGVCLSAAGTDAALFLSICTCQQEFVTRRPARTMCHFTGFVRASWCIPFSSMHGRCTVSPHLYVPARQFRRHASRSTASMVKYAPLLSS